MVDYKDQYKNDLITKSNEDLKKKYISLKNELIYMEECLNDKTTSYEQKSEFINSDIPSVKDSISIIEEILNTRKNK